VIVTIRTPAIELGALLKLAGLADTGGQAKVMIQGGSVRVNGEIERRRGRRLVAGDTVVVQGREAVRIDAPPS
jgi:ribosome-associated protein